MGNQRRCMISASDVVYLARCVSRFAERASREDAHGFRVAYTGALPLHGAMVAAVVSKFSLSKYPETVPVEPVVVIVNTISIAQRAPHPAAAKLFIDFLFSKPAQLKLREMSRIPSRSDVDSDPPRLIKGFKKVYQDIENESMSESIKLFQQTFGVSAG